MAMRMGFACLGNTQILLPTRPGLLARARIHVKSRHLLPDCQDVSESLGSNYIEEGQSFPTGIMARTPESYLGERFHNAGD